MMTPSPNALTDRSIRRPWELVGATHSQSPDFPYCCFPQTHFQTQSDNLYNLTANPCAARHERVQLKESDAIGNRFSIQFQEILCSNP